MSLLLAFSSGPPAYNPATDVARVAKQAAPWSVAETFQRALAPSLLVVLTSYGGAYNPATDVARTAKQAAVWSLPEAFPQAQRAYPQAIFAPYVAANDRPTKRQDSSVGTPETFIAPQLGRPLVLGFSSAYNPALELRRSQDRTWSTPDTFPQTQRTQLWPPYQPSNDTPRARQAIAWSDPATFTQPAAPSLLAILTPYSAPYDATLEPRRGFDRTWSTPETFPQAQRAYPQAIFAPYVAANDRPTERQDSSLGFLETFVAPQLARPLLLNVATPYDPSLELRAAQARAWSIPDAFPQAQGQVLLVTLTSYTPYDPSTDIARAGQDRTQIPPETYLLSAPFSAIVINGSAAPPEPPAPEAQAGGGGQVPGHVPGRKPKKPRDPLGPTMREDQVFGEEYAPAPGSGVAAPELAVLTPEQAIAIGALEAQAGSAATRELLALPGEAGAAARRRRALALLLLFMEA